MKIVLVHNGYRQFGGEDVVFDQERQLLEAAGHQVSLYRRSNSEIEAHSLVGQITLARKTVWAADTRREFAKLLVREKPQLVHVHNTFVMVSPSIYSACEEADVPVVQTLHNYRLLCPAATFFREGKVCEECPKHGLWRSVYHGCYRQSRPATATVALMLAVHRKRQTWKRMIDCYITLSHFARKKFVEAGFPAEKMFVKPNFVHPDPGARGSKGEYALFAGRLSVEKRVSTLLAAWERLQTNIPLIIVGDGPQRKELEAEAAQRGLSGVCFHGHLSRNQTLAAIKQARVLVSPSEWYECFPMAIVEAFASGTPVICSRIGAMQEIVVDGHTGLHFTPGDAEDLAEKVESAWARPGYLSEMGRAARAEYEAKYTAERNYHLLMDVYQRAIRI
jgi:glycosyltransferase involved in cell wall biosynthesis